MTKKIAILSFLAIHILTANAQSLPGNLPIRINAGGPGGEYGGVWFEQGDTAIYGNNGMPYTYAFGADPFSNTTVDDLFVSEMNGDSMGYLIPVIDNTCYSVHLHFAEIYFGAPGGPVGGVGSRIFDVVINGDTVLNNFDMTVEYWSAMVAGTKSFRICMATGENDMLIEFVSIIGGAKIGGIEVVPDGIGPCEPVPTNLPVSLLGMEARRLEKAVHLNWQTGAELNNDFFEIERSGDGVNYRTLVLVPGAGTTPEKQTYQWWDTDPLNGKAWYRLRQTDLDGHFTVFPAVEIAAPVVGPGIRVFPNPAINVIPKLECWGWEANTILRVDIRDMNGRRLASRLAEADAWGSRQLQLGEVNELSRGLYWVVITGRVKNAVKRQVQKLVLE